MRNVVDNHDLDRSNMIMVRMFCQNSLGLKLVLFEGTWRGIEASDEVVDVLGGLTHVHAAHLVVRSHHASH